VRDRYRCDGAVARIARGGAPADVVSVFVVPANCAMALQFAREGEGQWTSDRARVARDCVVSAVG
jgi:hypothetical protein